MTSNLGEGRGGYMMVAWEVHLGLHTIFLHDVVFCEPHYKIAQGTKRHYTYAHTIYQNWCSGKEGDKNGFCVLTSSVALRATVHHDPSLSICTTLYFFPPSIMVDRCCLWGSFDAVFLLLLLSPSSTLVAVFLSFLLSPSVHRVRIPMVKSLPWWMPPCKYHGAETLGIVRSAQQIMLFQQRNGCSNVLKL